MTIWTLYRAANEIEGYDARWAVLHPVMSAIENANDTIGADKDETPEWESCAVSSLEMVLGSGEATKEAMAWYTARGFRW